MKPNGKATGPRLPAPRFRSNVTSEAPTEESKVAQLIAMMENGSTNRLTAAQLAGYLRDNRRNAESLLAAFQTTEDKAYLPEALEKFPHDPQVNFTAFFRSDTPKEKQQRIEALKKAAPDNAMANYLAAQEAFKTGNTDLAVQELMTASGKNGWQDYSKEFIQSAEDAYRAAGWSEAEAKAMATANLLLPHLSEMKNLGQHSTELAKLYQQAGDPDSALAIRQAALAMGQHFEAESVGGFLLKSLVGINIQSQVLRSMDPANIYDDSGRTVKDELATLQERRNALKELGKQLDAIYPTLTERDIVSYFDRMKTFGELSATQWLVNRKKAN
ncbi:MAG TPA: hypothetical protein VGH19_07185 [Verrucomicrobiae bacterium]